MCMYSCRDGFATDWHLVHLGSRAAGGAGLVLTEATAVEARGRISPQDLGIWSDAHGSALEPVARFVKEHGGVAGIQLAHAGRKAGTHRPGSGSGQVPFDEGGWTSIAPSGEPFSPGDRPPEELSVGEIGSVVEAFAAAAARAVAAGFQLIEIHGAHGYLIHQFLSPLINRRTDAWGGSFSNRTRFLREVTTAIRRSIPADMPLMLRLSCTDWMEGGLRVEDVIALAPEVRQLGVDLIDCSSGGAVPGAQVPVGPGYQVPFARRIRAEAGIATGAVGVITTPEMADMIVRNGDADLVLLGRESLRSPYWPLHAARKLGHEAPVPPQYLRGW